MDLVLKEAATNPGRDQLWICEVDGNLGDTEAQAIYGDDRKLLFLHKSMFDKTINFRTDPVVVLALRSEGNSHASGNGQWNQARVFVQNLSDPDAWAQEFGYDDFTAMLADN